MALKHTVVATGTNDVTKQVSVTAWNNDHAFDTDGVVIPTTVTEPAAPAAGNIRAYAESLYAASLFGVKDSSGLDRYMATMPIDRSVTVIPPYSTTAGTFNTDGMGITTTGTTIAAVAPATTNKGTRQPRTSYATNATAGQLATMRGLNLVAHRGAAAGQGGFLYLVRFGLVTLAVGNRAFFGLADVVTAPTNIDPTTSTTPGKVGLAINANTGNWKLVNNLTGTAPTSLDLGATFPVNATDILELALYSAPAGTGISYVVTNLTSGATTSGTLTTNIPAVGTFLTPWYFDTNNATAGIVAFSHSVTYLEASLI
jgi:hypothetical protein